MFEPQKELNDFLQQLYTNELKKTVLLARANGETLEEVGMKLGVTREFVRQVEAKISGARSCWKWPTFWRLWTSGTILPHENWQVFLTTTEAKRLPD